MSETTTTTASPTTQSELQDIDSKIADLAKEINRTKIVEKSLRKGLDAATKYLSEITESHRKLLARKFIIENGVKLDQVWMSNHPCTIGLPTIYQMADWAAKQKERRPYLEWNGTIFPSSATLAVRLGDSDTLKFTDILEYELEQAGRKPK